MTIRYACCEHCREDEVHHLKPNTHQVWCNVETCADGKKPVASE